MGFTISEVKEILHQKFCLFPESEIENFTKFFNEAFDSRDKFYLVDWAERWTSEFKCKGNADTHSLKIMKKYGKMHEFMKKMEL